MFKVVLKLFVLILLFLRVNAIGFAQANVSDRLFGVVRLSNSEPLAGAVVLIKESQQNTVTDLNGKFIIQPVELKKFTLSIRMTGFQSYQAKLGITSLNKELKITLAEGDMQTGEVVVSANREIMKKREAPVMVNVIGNRLLTQTQAVSIADGLAFTPGLRTENNCQNCGFTQVRMNGLSGAYTQILINSRPVFSALGAVYGLEQMPANMIDRVEVVRGAGSVLYGGNAIAGTINIITKDPIEDHIEAGINQAFTGFSASDRTAHFNATSVSKDLKSGISLFAMNRNRQSYDANNDGFTEITKQENTTVGSNLYHKTSQFSRLSLSYFLTNEYRRGGNNIELPPHQAAVAEELKHIINNVNVNWQVSDKEANKNFATYVSAQTIQRKSYYGGGGRVLNDTLINSGDLSALNAYGNSRDVAAVGGVQGSLKLGKFNTIAGTEYQFAQVADNMPSYYRTINQTVGVWGTYVQSDYKLNPMTSIMAGFRGDLFSINGDYNFNGTKFKNVFTRFIPVPRLAISHQANEKLKLRASYAQGYRAPQAFDEDLHIETVGGAARFSKLSPNLKTERSDAFSISADWLIEGNFFQKNITVEGFYTMVRDAFITSDPVEGANGISIVEKRNSAGMFVRGVNAELRLSRGRYFSIQAGATAQHAMYNNAELIWASAASDGLKTETQQVLRTPDFYGYHTFSWQKPHTIGISVNGRFTGNMTVAHVLNPIDNYTVLKSTPMFYDLAFKLWKEFKINEAYELQVSTGINNVLNSYQRDFDRGALRDAAYIYGPAAPSTIYVSLKVGTSL